jgi:hypothetical protein
MAIKRFRFLLTRLPEKVRVGIGNFTHYATIMIASSIADESLKSL